MQEQFVTYEIAKELKELGFNNMCIATFADEDDFELQDFGQNYDTFPSHVIAVPLWQQVVDWFGKEHNLSIEIAVGENMWEYNIMSIIGFDVQICSGIVFSSCEDARKQGILKSIELCKNKK